MKLQFNPVRPGAILFVLAFVVFALFLLTQLGAETKFSSRGKLFAQPRFWPAVGVLGMAGFGAAHLLLNLRTRVPGLMPELLTWAKALEYFAWFMVYVVLVPIVGYLPATVCFTVFLALRRGYRSKRSLWLAAILGLCVVLIFKTGLSVKIPGGAVYEYLPSGIRTFMIVNF